ncbi:related to Putative pyridoxal reductase [Saccharomycodes ludwigii]|uniref:Related to Putative pyridoxal reductase n=1 Tax=Saccharomycodes ludwigii TaxID=36035 RepID=A0A376B4J0_9ASCO|nr:hypothetical protein SCDLUD_000606 [Saccharomycodes ludwigii]KAH3903002.1 hypothetical protein SCDLUD_000606 [Saccharomycodes ludwigii]SSD59608.1 related to Putative pyridoxal reductase [Saccharomycodes ludwigii]
MSSTDTSAAAQELRKSLLNDVSTSYGLMGLTWRAEPVTYDLAKYTLDEVLKTCPSSKVMFNVGEFYGNDGINLEYCYNYISHLDANDRERVIVSCKGGVDLKTLIPDGRREFVAKSIESCLHFLKYIDIFQVARVDMEHWRESFDTIVEYIKKGKIGGISLSEVTLDQLKTINKEYGDYICCAELEFSMYSRHILDDGTIAYCNEIGLPIVCYSPLGAGILTGAITKNGDIPSGDFRKSLKMMSDNGLKQNLQLVEYLKKNFYIEGKRSLPQIAISWILHYNKIFKKTNLIPLPGGTTPDKVRDNLTACVDLLSDAEFAQINEFLKTFNRVGSRYEFAA